MSSAPAPDFDHLLQQVQNLPEEQRVRFVEEIQATPIRAHELGPELREELLARLKSIESGTAELLDHDEMMRNVRAQFTR